MKSKILLTLLMLLFIPFVSASVNITLVPANLFQTTDTSINFNWTINTTNGSDSIMPVYLFITNQSNESHLLLNTTINYVSNATPYNISITDFVVGFYKWNITVGADVSRPQRNNTIARPWNTTTNSSLSIAYTKNTTVEACTVTFSATDNITPLVAITNITAACNLTVTNTSNAFSITTQGVGGAEYINITGNASGIFGLTTGIIKGTQNNYSTGGNWFEILEGGASGNHTNFKWTNDSGFIAMTLHKDNGNLNVTGNIVGGANLTIPGINFTNGSIEISGNLSLGQKITFAFGEMIDNIRDNIIRVTSNLLAAQNIEVGNLTVNDTITLTSGGEINTTNNGDIVLNPNGTGTVNITKELFVGSTVNVSQSPNAQVIISHSDSGYTQGTTRTGLISESAASSSISAIGIVGTASTNISQVGYGVVGVGRVSNTNDSAQAIGTYGLSNTAHTNGSNIGVYGYGSNGRASFSFYGAAGLLYNAKNATINGSLVNISTGNLDVGGNVTVAQTLKVDGNITIDGTTLKNVTQRNSKISGPVFGIYQTGPSGVNLPHIILQSGGDTQASVIMRSVIISDEIASFHNGPNATDCGSYMSFINESLRIDCNTTTSGADLIVSDDFQVVGDVYQKDVEGDYHFLTRTLSLLDEIYNNILFDKVNVSVSGTTLTITDIKGDNLVINLAKNETIKSVNNESVTITFGTNATPVKNFITYQTTGNPTLTTSISHPSVDHANVMTIIAGAQGSYYTSFENSNGIDTFAKNVQERFFDEGAIYETGFSQNVSTTSFNITNGSMKIIIEEKTTPINLSSAVEYFFVQNNGTYRTVNSFDNMTQYSDGGAIGNNKYFNVVFGVVHNDLQDSRLMAIVQNEPSSEYNSVANAEVDEENKLLTFPSDSLLSKTFIPVGRVVMQRTGSTTNTIQTLLGGSLFLDLRGTATATGGSAPSPSITDHGQLGGLSDDDHPQYVLTTGDNMTGPLVINSSLNISGSIKIKSHFIIDTVNITCLNTACSFFSNATDGCITYPPSGFKVCG